MERTIRIAWRAFWVGLGASAVLVTQSLLPPKILAPPRAVAPMTEDAPAPAPLRITHPVSRS